MPAKFCIETLGTTNEKERTKHPNKICQLFLNIFFLSSCCFFFLGCENSNKKNNETKISKVKYLVEYPRGPLELIFLFKRENNLSSRNPIVLLESNFIDHKCREQTYIAMGIKYSEIKCELYLNGFTKIDSNIRTFINHLPIVFPEIDLTNIDTVSPFSTNQDTIGDYFIDLNHRINKELFDTLIKSQDLLFELGDMVETYNIAFNLSDSINLEYIQEQRTYLKNYLERCKGSSVEKNNSNIFKELNELYNAIYEFYNKSKKTTGKLSHHDIIQLSKFRNKIKIIRQCCLKIDC